MNLDPIKAADDAAMKRKHGKGVKITWQNDGGSWSGDAVETLLVERGVYVYARQYSKKEGNDYGITVRTKQAKWAEHIMRKAGIPLTSGNIDKSNAAVQPGKVPTPWGAPVDRQGVAGRVLTALNGEPRRSERKRSRRKRRGER